MHTRISLIILAWSCSILLCMGQTDRKNELPPEVLQVYRSAKTVRLFSLEPTADISPKDDRFHDYKVLGETTLNWEQTVAAFELVQKGIADPSATGAFCFAPRHGFRVSTREYHYDLLLCFECGWVHIFRDKERLAVLELAASPTLLNTLLRAGRVPLAKTVGEAEIAALQKEMEAEEARWLAGMPASLRPYWKSMKQDFPMDANVEALRQPLAKQYPKTQDRILALFAWSAQGSATWSGTALYESYAEHLLNTFSVEELIAAAGRDDLTNTHLEGAARYFVGWPEEKVARLPTLIRRKLLIYAVSKEDPKKIQMIKDAFDVR